MIQVVATDLDRTLIPNGKQEYDNSMVFFKKIIKRHKLKLVYITGRDFGLVKKAIKKYSLPTPDYLICDVGASIFLVKNSLEKLERDKGWIEGMKKNTPGWNIEKFKKSLKNIKGIKLQEDSKQSKYKLSYYFEIGYEKEILKNVKKRIKEICPDSEIVYSEDYPEKRGLLDILPKIATKKGALDYLVKKMKLKKEEVLFCGDSGNDYSLFISDYNAVVVRNASLDIKKKVKEERKKKGNLDRLYIAKNKKKQGLNGNYVSGIIQGLEYFGIR